MAVKTRSVSLNLVLESTQGKTYAVIIVTVLVVVLLLFVAAVPAYLSITNQIVKNESKAKYLQDLQTKEGNLKTLSEQEKDFLNEIDLVNVYFKDKRNDEFMIANLEKLAEKSSLKMMGVNFEITKAPSIPELGAFGLFSAVPFSASFRGQIKDFEKIVEYLETFPSTLTINSISYSKQEEGDGGFTADQVFVLAIQAEYYFWNYEE